MLFHGVPGGGAISPNNIAINSDLVRVIELFVLSIIYHAYYVLVRLSRDKSAMEVV